MIATLAILALIIFCTYKGYQRGALIYLKTYASYFIASFIVYTEFGPGALDNVSRFCTGRGRVLAAEAYKIASNNGSTADVRNLLIPIAVFFIAYIIINSIGYTLINRSILRVAPVNKLNRAAGVVIGFYAAMIILKVASIGILYLSAYSTLMADLARMLSTNQLYGFILTFVPGM